MFLNIILFWRKYKYMFKEKNESKKLWYFKFIKILLLLTLLFSIDTNLRQTFASGIFSGEHYRINKNKSMLVCPCGRNFKSFEWKLTNNNVLSLDDRGFIKALNKGSCTIEAADKISGEISLCNITVTEPEIIKSIYVTPNKVIANLKSSIYIITDSNVKELEVHLSGEKYESTFHPTKNKLIKNGTLWSVETIFPEPGKYVVTTHELSSLKHNTCKNGIIDVTVYNCEDLNVSSLTSKKASEKCVKFISECEGFVARITPDYKGRFSIGYGHSVFPFVPFYDEISREEALSILINDINNADYGTILNNFLIKNYIEFNQNQFDALLSFTYNLGAGWLNKDDEMKDVILNCGDGHKILKGIVRSSNGLNLRQSPCLKSKRIRAMKNGEEVEILSPNKYNNSWYFIKSYTGEKGYCYSEYLDIKYSYSSNAKNLNKINKEKFIQLFCEYHHAGGKCNTALLSRRFYELDIFFKGQYSNFDNLYFKKSSYSLPSCIKKYI